MAEAVLVAVVVTQELAAAVVADILEATSQRADGAGKVRIRIRHRSTLPSSLFTRSPFTHRVSTRNTSSRIRNNSNTHNNPTTSAKQSRRE